MRQLGYKPLPSLSTSKVPQDRINVIYRVHTIALQVENVENFETTDSKKLNDTKESCFCLSANEISQT